MDSDKKGRGRPRKDTATKIDNEIDNEIDDNEDNYYQEDKKHLEIKEMSSEAIDIDEEILKEIEDIDKKNAILNDDIPDSDYNPLEEAVEDRGYTKGIVQQSNIGIERIIDEPIYSSNTSVRPDVDEKLLNPDMELPKSKNSSSSNTSNSNNSNNSNSSSNSNSSNSNSDNQSNGSENTNNNTNSNSNSNSNNSSEEKKLTPKEQREAAEKTAEIALLAYQNYIPLPFIYFSQFKVKKLKESEKQGEIDLQAPFDRKGTPFIDYVNRFNKEAENTFAVSDEEVAAIKEPLIDVLMEKEVSLTPTQRLVFVAGQFLVAKVINVVRLVAQRKSDMEDLKEMHKEKMESERLNRETILKATKIKRKKENTDEEKDSIFVKNNSNTASDESEKYASDDITKSEVVNYTNIPTIDDVINTDVDDEEEEEENQIINDNYNNDNNEDNNDDDDDNDIPD